MGKTGVMVETVGRAPASGIRLSKAHAAREREEGVSRVLHVAPDDLEDIVEHVTLLHWEIERGASSELEVRPCPNVEIGFGDARAGVHGPVTRRSSTQLTRQGTSVLVTFRPGGSRGLLRPGIEPRQLVDQTLPARDVLAASAEATALGESLASAVTDDERMERVHAFLRAHHPGLDDEDRELNAIVDVARLDPTLTRVARLAELAGRPTRAVERLVRSRLGLSAKWLLRRYRIEETHARILRGLPIDLEALGSLLGYVRREDLASDFRTLLGRSSTAYLRSA